MISLSRLPLGSVGSGAVEEGASDDGVLIVRACSARQLDRVAKLLATVTRSTSLAPLRPKTRWGSLQWKFWNARAFHSTDVLAGFHVCSPVAGVDQRVASWTITSVVSGLRG